MKTNYAKIQSFMAKHAIKKSEEELVKESQALYNDKKAEEEKLIQLYEDKKLKNPDTIRKAKSIKAKRNKNK